MLVFNFRKVKPIAYLVLCLSTGFLMSYTNPKLPLKQVDTEFRLKWSDHASITFTREGDAGELVINIYVFAGEKTSLLNSIRQKRQKPVDFSYYADLLKDGKKVGCIAYDWEQKVYTPKEQRLSTGIWQSYGSFFEYKNDPKNPNDPYQPLPMGKLQDGNYQIKVTVQEVNAGNRTKIFPFTIKNGNVVGNSDISRKAFMKAHELRRFDGSHIFLLAE